ncbi:MAG: hypothetical protein HKN36_09305 [Hellea sp.]|nr:hypothetical protein [Hellea sp.]
MKLTLYSRRYAPFKTFGGGFSGDNRLYSENISATSKTSGVVTIEYKGGKFIVGQPIGKSSGSSHTMSGEKRGTAIGKVKATISNKRSIGNKLSFTLYTEGNLPIRSMLASGASRSGKPREATSRTLQGSPDIDTFVDIEITANPDQSLKVEGKLRGDGFPNAELFIKDGRQGSWGLVDFRTKSGKAGPLHRLFGSGKNNTLCTFSRDIAMANGFFTSKPPPPKTFQEK